MHVQSQALLGMCVVGGLLNSADDKVPAKHGGKQTRLTVAVFISSYVTGLTFFSTISGLTGREEPLTV